MKCQKCGKEIKEVRVNFFEYDGNDDFYIMPIKQVPHNAVVIDVDSNWTGNDLTMNESLFRRIFYWLLSRCYFK